DAFGPAGFRSGVVHRDRADGGRAAPGADCARLLAVGRDTAERRNSRRGVMLHFAYGANMSRAVMKRHAPAARAVGPARFRDHRFIITADGYASVEPARACVVHGVLWRLTPRDRVMLDAWENISGALYRAETLAVICAGRRTPALVYIARPSG